MEETVAETENVGVVAAGVVGLHFVVDVVAAAGGVLDVSVPR